MAAGERLMTAQDNDDQVRIITPFRVGVLLAAAGVGVWMGFKWADWQNWLGFSRVDYFVRGTVYAFTSGPGPMLLTALLGGTIIGGLWHHLNCHTAGCPRLVRHKIAGGEYGVCSHHWRQINGHPAGHRFTVEHLRERHEAHLRDAGRPVAVPPEAV